MKIKPITFSFAVSLFIAFFFLLITFWIFYEHSGSKISANDALSTTGSYFGAVATLSAAIIAAYLFTDWKEPHNKEVKNKFAFQVYDNFIILTNSILDYGLFIETLNPPKKQWKFTFNTTKSVSPFISSIYELNKKYDRINIEISYFFDRLREYGVVTGQELQINFYIQEYLAIFITITENKISEAQTIEECIEVYKKVYTDYNALRDKINLMTIAPLLKGLQTNQRKP